MFHKTYAFSFNGICYDDRRLTLTILEILKSGYDLIIVMSVNFYYIPLKRLKFSGSGSMQSTSLVSPRACILFLSIIKHRLSRELCAANIIASQLLPSFISPSPTRQYIAFLIPLRFEPKASPQATGKPCPRLPVDSSTPGSVCDACAKSVCHFLRNEPSIHS